jgi:hypothetical protein
VEIAEHPVAGPDDRGGFPLDQLPKGITIAGEDQVDDRLIGALRVRLRGSAKSQDVRSSPRSISRPS